MSPRHRLVAVLAAAAVGACALLPGPAPQRDAVPAALSEAERVRENAEVSALLAYYQWLLDLPAEALRREYHGINQAYARERSEMLRLRLAMLLNVPGAAWHDDARLVALLEAAASGKAPPDSPRRQLVVFMLKTAAERLRGQRRAEDLQQKLESIMAIERSLRERQPQTK